MLPNRLINIFSTRLWIGSMLLQFAVSVVDLREQDIYLIYSS
jgi:hypothetical protein